MIVTKENIIDLLPYNRPFLFADKITSLNDEQVIGEYTFRKDESFYEGHFRDNPVTPGVILVECMAQIGLVSLGIYLLRETLKEIPSLAFSNAKVDFLRMILPGEKVIVESQKKYFRLGKLNCDVEMKNESGEIACRGNLSGFIIPQKN